MSIVFCQATYLERKEQTFEGLRRIAPYVDRCVVVAPEPSEQWKFKEFPYLANLEFYHAEWVDDFPAYRNKYLSKCRPGDWVIVSDPDEWFCDEFCKDLRSLIQSAADKGIGLLLINSHDVTFRQDGTTDSTVSDFFKNLIFRYSEGVRYEGVGEAKNVHETLILPPGTKSGMLDRKYYYEHTKYWWEVWERAARNVWIGGGGNNVGEKNPAWKPLREICNVLGFKGWPMARAYFREGSIDERLKEWLWENRFEGFDWQHEMMEMGRWYFEYLHPDEATFPDGRVWKPVTELRPGTPEEIMRFIEQSYLKVLGRHADDAGKNFYLQAITTGTIKREQLEAVLQESPEYKEKHAQPIEKVKMQVPVSVEVNLSPGLFLEAFRRSETYHREIKPMVDLWHKWAALLKIPAKVESGGKGNDYSPPEGFSEFIQLFKTHAPAESFPRILDIGAGAGVETDLLAKEGYKVIGITMGRDNIQFARESYGIQLLEMDMHVLEFPSGYFDGAFSVQTFEHTFAPWLFILEARRVLRDGGRILVDVPDPNDQSMLDTIWHTSVLYPNQLQALFAKAGFLCISDRSVKHRVTMIFEKLPDGKWEMWSYVKHIMEAL